jgi:16S rRNA (uracil1498-N3)-methyltransferase
MHRFFLRDLTGLTLAGKEAHHARQVLRVRVGEEAVVFDGAGNFVRGQVAEIGRDAVQLRALERGQSPPLLCRITLACAVIKKNMDFIVQKATELGVATIVPLLTERTIARPDRSDRWADIALEACKQCGNNWLPEIAAPVPLTKWLATKPMADLKVVAALTPDAHPLRQVLRPALSACVLIGPEGDFTPAEYAAAQSAGYWPVTLGPLVLRADTAALYALSIVHHELVTHRGVC